MDKINKINLDGTEYEVGGQEYTAGEGIKIENGVISALGGAGGSGGGSKLYKHTYLIEIRNGGSSCIGKKVDYSSNATPMTQADFVAWVSAEMVKTKYKINFVRLENGDNTIWPITIYHPYYGGANIDFHIETMGNTSADENGYITLLKAEILHTTIEGLDCSETLNNLITSFTVTTEEV